MRKLHRWTDLLAALLRRRYPVPLETLLDEVPAYGRARDNKGTLRRMFERDKDELRAFGIPIETVTDPSGEVAGYQLRRERFYLPYLTVAGDGGTPRRVDRDGFRSLAELAFEPDELAVIAQAARRVEALSEPGLAAHAASALRKLSVDLPMDAAGGDDPTHLTGGTGVDPQVFESLDRGLTLRKRVSFDYHAIGSDERSRRTVEPFGIFYLGHNWYLAAREPDGTVVKNFRMSRIGAVEVEFAADGTAAAAARLGAPVPGRPNHRCFRVRRSDAFVRWLLSLGGSAVPVAPPQIVREYRDAVSATLAVYERTAGGAE